MGIHLFGKGTKKKKGRSTGKRTLAQAYHDEKAKFDISLRKFAKEQLDKDPEFREAVLKNEFDITITRISPEIETRNKIREEINKTILQDKELLGELARRRARQLLDRYGNMDECPRTASFAGLLQTLDEIIAIVQKLETLKKSVGGGGLVEFLNSQAGQAVLMALAGAMKGKPAIMPTAISNPVGAASLTSPPLPEKAEKKIEDSNQTPTKLPANQSATGLDGPGATGGSAT